MATTKMKYGIDLGTTNSSLCRFENNDLNIIKSDTLQDTIPSCVSFVKKGTIRVGDAAYNDLRSERTKATKKWTRCNENVYSEFKRTMGLNTKYKPANNNKTYSSEDLSAEVLKTLLGFVSTEKITASVITIPSKFKTDQIAATKRAAELAGIKHCELLQEPIAAALAYGINSKNKTGNWLVFDFGGGTFDVALLNVQEGIIQVKDTEGDNYLGGKNIDYAIIDQILLPHLEKKNTLTKLLSKPYTASILRESLKFYAETIKNTLSDAEACEITSQLDEFGLDDQKNEIELDITVTREEVAPVIKPFFQKAIDICLALLERNKITAKDITSLVLVGGPTYSSILRDMLRTQITPNIDTSINPMTAVAIGSALFASMVDYEEDFSDLTNKDFTLTLDVNYEPSTVETIEYVTIKPLSSKEAEPIPNELMVEIVRSDQGWSSGKIPLNIKGEVFECYLLEGKSNTFQINVFDSKGSKISCHPQSFSILQGTKIINDLLPYYIGVEVHDFFEGKDIFTSLKGLEKNVFLPASGIIKDLRTPTCLRPDNSNDKLVIPIYQGEYDANGSTAMYNDHVFDVVVTGSDITAHVDEFSSFDIMINIDRSQMMSVEVTFGTTGECIRKPIYVAQRKTVNIKSLEEFLSLVKAKYTTLQENKSVEKDELVNIEKAFNDINTRFGYEKNSEDGKMHLLADLRRLFLAIEKMSKKYGFEPLFKELKKTIAALKDSYDYLDNNFDDLIESAETLLNDLEKSKDFKQAELLLKQLRLIYIFSNFFDSLYDFITEQYRHFNPSFWTDPIKAKSLLKEIYTRLSYDEEILSNEELLVMVEPLFNLAASKNLKGIKFFLD
ncbi:MAG: Hsp70 family protein [Desulfovibrio sp.]|nr:Hsp70 family protein [Desulfovibrio sp.]